MRFHPHAYQQRAIDHATANPVCGLFLDMGLGKTVVTLTVIARLVYELMEVVRVLVIAPLRVAETVWAQEAAKWDHTRHLRVSLVLGPERQRKEALRKEADVYVINRENVTWLASRYGSAFPFDMVVIDELSSFKSPKAMRFKALRQVRPTVSRVMGLTGTPAPNGLIDLWSQMYLLDRGERLEKTVGAYRRKYFSPGRTNGQVVFDYKLRGGSEREIYRRISDICVSMAAEDHLDLPPRIDNVVLVDLPPAERRCYAKMEKVSVLELPEGDISAVNAAALSTKLLQLANGACYGDSGEVLRLHDRKLDALEEIMEEAQGAPVLCFTAFRHDGARVLRRFPGAVRLDGEDEITAWNAGRVRLLIAHPASAGHGLNLQAGGSIVCWFGLTWSLELYQQANARIHRQGQGRAVIVHHIVLKDSIDEDVMAALSRKAMGQDSLLAAVKARAGRYRM
jgi:SNF2 family DNA or RNA helicase